MRVLKHLEIDQDIVLSKNKHFNLVIENPLFFREFLNGLTNQIDNDDPFFLFYKDDKEDSLKKHGFLVLNPMKIEIDDKKINGLIQKDIASKVGEDKKVEFEELINRINEYLKSITYDYPVPVTFDMDLSLASFLKAISASAVSEYDSFLEYLINQVKKISFILKSDVFFFLNLHDYLSENEFHQFEEEMSKLEVDYVLISSHKPLVKPDDEFVIEIDRDLCELHIDVKD